MAAPPPPTLQLLLVLLACVRLASALRPPLLVNKCCSLAGVLTRGPLACSLPSQSSHAAQDVRSETASALLQRHPRGFPPWMDLGVPLYRADTLAAAAGASLLEKQPDGAYVRYGAYPVCAASHRQVVFAEDVHRYKLLTSGKLLLNLSSWGGVGEALLAPEEYCVDHMPERANNGNGTYLFIACPCERFLCVRKCCKPNTMFVDDAADPCGVWPVKAGPGTTPKWRPTFRRAQRTLEEAPTHHLMYTPMWHLECGDDMTTVILNSENDQRHRMWVLENGSALMENFGQGRPIENDRWCGELSLNNGSVVDNARFCLAYSSSEPMRSNVRAMGVLYMVSALFLLMTLGVYGLLPDLHASPYSKAFMCHCATLMIGSVALSVLQLTSGVTDGLCQCLAVITQFCFLATFFWLNVLCIDISWTFRGLRGILRNLDGTSSPMFLYYCAYAMGSPLVITSVTVGIHIGSKNGVLPSWVVLPNVGDGFCWFNGTAALWAYFYGPMAALLVANTALFAFTAVRLAHAHKHGGELNRGESVRHDRSSRLSAEKRRLILYVKLFLLMGVTWILEVVSWAVKESTGADYLEDLWMPFDIINALRGILIFIIFCCKRRVLKMLQARFSRQGLREQAAPSGCLSGLSSNRTTTLHLSPDEEMRGWAQWLPSARQSLPAASAANPGSSPHDEGEGRLSRLFRNNQDEVEEKAQPLPSRYSLLSD